MKEIIFAPLFSGSNGNASIVQYGNTCILIDAGRSGKQLIQAMEKIGITPDMLDAVLVTHEHSDHIAGVGVLARRYGLPVYATEGTWAVMEEKVKEIPSLQMRMFDHREDFYIGDLGIVPFAIPHDAADPVGYRLHGGGISVAIATDLGYFSPRVEVALKGADLVLLESNHDPEMLQQNPRYSAALKKRILGKHGHLCNEDSAEAMMKLMYYGTRRIILGHLSGENNTPELAMTTAMDRLRDEGADGGMVVSVASRDGCEGVFRMYR